MCVVRLRLAKPSENWCVRAQTLPVTYNWIDGRTHLVQHHRVESTLTGTIFYNYITYIYSTTNNYKLIQHQYKIFMKIATSKYLRYKMKIENNPNCHICVNIFETLGHIYLECPKTLAFLEQVEELIRARVDETYTDHHKILHFSYNHPIKR